MSITVAHESCVRLLSIKSECTRCEEACSFDALSFANSILRLKTSSCTSCGACVGVCPTGAITLFSFEGLASIVASKDEFTFGANEDGFLPEAFSNNVPSGPMPLISAGQNSRNLSFPFWKLRVYFSNGLFYEEVWRYGSIIETLSSENLKELMTDVCENYGYD